MKLLIVGAVGILLCTSAFAGTINVTTTDDELNTDGDCSLREALVAANTNADVDGCTTADFGDDTIVLPAGTYSLMLEGTGEDDCATGDLDVLDAVTFEGAGALLTTIDASGLTERDRVLHRINDVSLTLRGLTISGGEEAYGGGIQAANGLDSTFTMENCILRDNVGTTSGGGVYTSGKVVVRQCTFVDNVSSSGGGMQIDNTQGLNAAVSHTTFEHNTLDGAGSGGAINISSNAMANIANCTFVGNEGVTITVIGEASLANVTITQNSSTFLTAGVWVPEGGVLRLNNTLIAGNVLSGGGLNHDCNGAVISNGHNLIGDSEGCADLTETDIVDVDANLPGLASNGGDTKTVAIDPNSLAFDAGDSTSCSEVDQRGRARLGACDIGAFEFTCEDNTSDHPIEACGESEGVPVNRKPKTTPPANDGCNSTGSSAVPLGMLLLGLIEMVRRARHTRLRS